MASNADLSQSISAYEEQLEKVNVALEVTTNLEEKQELLLLKDNIIELLKLTKESLENVQPSEAEEGFCDQEEDPLADEYALFKAELSELSPNTSEVVNEKNTSGEENDDSDLFGIQDELDQLIGSKCQAPYTDKTYATHYYNALVSGVSINEDASDHKDIQVRVLFTNPIEKEMIPCPYYLDGKCKFSDSKCNYSHGYMVPFYELKEYRNPDFKLLKHGCRVLAKPPGSQLWVSARLEQIITDDTCSITYQGNSIVIPVHDLLPLSSVDALVHSSSEDEDDPSHGIRDFSYVVDFDAIVEKSLNQKPNNQKIGAWEEHTKGIGSKLMAKMGYVVGTGLGKEGEGRIEPVTATILPPGKSLDHCMNLREIAGGSNDLFSAERIQKKLALKAQRQSERMYKKQLAEEKHNVFNIINNTLTSGNHKAQEDHAVSKSYKRKLESSSSRSLNVEKLKVEEEIDQIERDVFILNDKLSLKKEGSSEHRHLFQKLQSTKSHLESLQKKDKRISWEINQRDTKKKMIF